MVNWAEKLLLQLYLICVVTWCEGKGTVISNSTIYHYRKFLSAVILISLERIDGCLGTVRICGLVWRSEWVSGTIYSQGR